MKAAGFLDEGEHLDFDAYNSLHRMVKCRRVTSGANDVEIKTRSTENGPKASYSGVMVCGNVWACPICCHNVMEVRRKEVCQAFDWAYSNGCKVVMVTYTLPHYIENSCEKLIKGLCAASRSMKSYAAYKRAGSSFGLRGAIRSLEVTWNPKQGWNPHAHELLIVDDSADADALREALSGAWEAACRKHSLVPRGRVRAFRKHAVHIRDCCDQSGYITKLDSIDGCSADGASWGADREVTGFYLKDGRRGSLTPFQLAASAADGVAGAWELFEEYLAAFKGRNPVRWTPGLKALVGVGEVSDEVCSDDIPPESPAYSVVSSAFISRDVFSWAGRTGRRAHLLDVVENGGYPALRAYLSRYGYSARRPFSDSMTNAARSLSASTED